MRWRRLRVPAKVVFTLVLCAALLRYVDIDELGRVFGALRVGTLLIAATLLCLQPLLLAWRWQMLLRLLGQRLPLSTALRWLLVGLFFNQALPTAVGGDVLRVWALHRRGTAPGTAFASVALERLTGVALIGLMITACLPAMGPGLPAGAMVALAATGPLLAAALALLALADRLPLSWLAPRLLPSLAATSYGLRALVAAPADGLAVAALGIASALCGFTAAWVLATALGVDQPLAAVIVVLGGATLISVLPISLGGWGVREASVVALFSALGVAPENALALSIAFGLLQVLTSLPGGLLWWLDGRDKPADMPALDVAPPTR